MRVACGCQAAPPSIAGQVLRVLVPSGLLQSWAEQGQENRMGSCSVAPSISPPLETEGPGHGTRCVQTVEKQVCAVQGGGEGDDARQDGEGQHIKECCF